MPSVRGDATSDGLRRASLVLIVLVLMAVAGVGSYLYARRDSSGIATAAERRGTALAQLEAQLRSAAKQNDILAQEVRQGTRALRNAGNDTQRTEKRLRQSLNKIRKTAAHVRSKQQKLAAKLRSLSSGLSATLGSVQYIPPAKKGQAGSVQGSITIHNSTAATLDAVCVVDVGAVEYAIISSGVPSKGSSVESFQFPYSGPKPSGSTAGGCGRM